MEPLCPEGLDEDGLEEGEDDDGELLGDDGELLGDEGELLGDEGELLGDGMLGDGSPDEGELGGGLLLLEEQPATPRAAARTSMGSRCRAFRYILSQVPGTTSIFSPPEIRFLRQDHVRCRMESLTG